VPLTAIVQQVVQQGPAAVTDEEWRQQRAMERKLAASEGFAQAALGYCAVRGEEIL
jgi:hypothetical protein